ncbi:uncharacterized protein LOC120358107 [Solenopsis invicta]|uniref:uncharacterized protein LOC120358107 n=1 Tax=Solenopsis invicta TaxID=13686 RepID=UPI00193CEEE3|nr:uncharacterized protein LOC120358107 [Solenopsis invicta]
MSLTDSGPSETNEARPEIQASEFRNAKLPQFWREEPKLWFAMLEREFAAYNVKSDAVKCAAVIRHLDTPTTKIVADIVAAPPSNDSFGDIKTALISRLAASEEAQLRQLLTGLELNDWKPSELLREMTRLAGSNIAACVLQTLWLQRLPKRIQELLTVVGDMELKKLAELADKAMERSGVQEVALVSRNDAVPTAQSPDSEIAALTKRIGKLEMLMRRTARSRSQSRNRRNFSRNQDGNRNKSKDR